MPRPGTVWKYSSERLDELQDSGEIEFGLSSEIPARKRYLDDDTIEVSSIWSDISPDLTRTKSSHDHFYLHGKEKLRRLTLMGSNPGDLVLDPLVGTGSFLRVAQQEERRWVGCEPNRDYFSVAANLLQKGEQETSQPSLFDDREQLIHLFPAVHPAPSILQRVPFYSTLPESEELPKVPLIFTEGKTDWKHLASAYNRLRDAGYLRKGFLLEFSGDESDMGDTELLGMCRAYARHPQIRPFVFIFDRDNARILPDIAEGSSSFRNWSNGVYSVALAVPPHRQDISDICIELLYTDTDLRRSDHMGRRLYLSNEFNDKSGRHTTENLSCRRMNDIKRAYHIIDSGVYNEFHQNVALAKSEFANYVFDRHPGFDDLDIAGFLPVFELIQQAMESFNSTD